MAIKKAGSKKVIAQVGHLRIKQVSEYKGEGKQRKCSTSYIAIYNGKKELEKISGSRKKAIERARELLAN